MILLFEKLISTSKLSNLQMTQKQTKILDAIIILE